MSLYKACLCLQRVVVREKMAVDAVKEKALADYRKKLLEHKEV
jgi:hypothetical protein